MDTVYVVPANDLVEHNTDSDDCVCIPRPEALRRDDGSVGWIMVHHSLDGRERNELGTH